MAHSRRAARDHKHPYDEVPWFCSNPCNIVLHVAGLAVLGAGTTEGSEGAARFFLSTNAQGERVPVSIRIEQIFESRR